MMSPTKFNKPAAGKAFCALPDILERGRFSKSHLYNLMARGQFPKPAVRIGPRFTRWSAEELDQWFAAPAQWASEHAIVAGQD